MANVKITQLAADTNPASTDVLPFVDISSDETKKVTIADLLENAGEGSAGSPSFSFDVDSDTGMYRAGPDALAFATNGGERLFISNVGNIGFGTSQPSAIAHLRADGNDLKSMLYLQNRNGGANAGVQIAFSNSTNDQSDNRLAYIRAFNTGASQNGNNLTFGTNQNGVAPEERVRITSTGNVGIGTTDPQRKLDVVGNVLALNSDNSKGALLSNDGCLEVYRDTSNPFIDFKTSIAEDFDCRIQQDSNGLTFTTGGNNSNAERMRIDSAGQVGIGTGSDIDGQLEVRSDSSLGVISRSTSTQSTNSNKAYRARNNSATDTFSVSYKGQGYFADSLGLGTSSPGNTLHLSGTNGVGMRVENTSNSISAYSTLESSGALQANISGAGVFSWVTGGGEKVRIDNSGRLLVGTSSYYSAGDANTPSNLVYVENTGFNYQSFVGIANRTDIFGSVIVLGKTRGTAVGSNTIVQDDDQLGIIRFVGADGVDRSPVGGAIECQVDGTPGSNDMPGRLVFSTTADGAATPTERMRITNNGELRLNTGGGNVDVGSGTTDGVTFYNPSNPAAGAIQTSTNGGAAMYLRRRTSDGTIIDFRRDTTSVGAITVTTTATAYNTSSDYRLKENVVDIADGITRVKQLQPRRFNFIADADTTVDGFLAHEAQTVVPEAVTGEKDGEEMQGIDQSKLVPLLTAALQEAIAKIETLEQRLTDAGL